MRLGHVLKLPVIWLFFVHGLEFSIIVENPINAGVVVSFGRRFMPDVVAKIPKTANIIVGCQKGLRWVIFSLYPTCHFFVYIIFGNYVCHLRTCTPRSFHVIIVSFSSFRSRSYWRSTLRSLFMGLFLRHVPVCFSGQCLRVSDCTRLGTGTCFG